MKIPKIIHQVWSGVDEPLPVHFKKLGQTWKDTYPDWEYKLWDNDMMNMFIDAYCPEYRAVYDGFPYNVQRWDAIRYLILYYIGGMYVDFDYESLESMENLLVDKTCCFAVEPASHCRVFYRPVDFVFNNALMLSVKGHPFMKKIINGVFDPEDIVDRWGRKEICVLRTTGPWKLIDLYDGLSEQEKAGIYMIPDKYVTPFDVPQALRLRMGERSEELEACLEEAYAVHYFFGNWRADNR